MKKLEIKKCVDCPFMDTTGAFTKGGSKPCCDHPFTVKEKGDDCFKRVIPYKVEYILGDRPIRIPKRIPDWCPLKDN